MSEGTSGEGTRRARGLNPHGSPSEIETRVLEYFHQHADAMDSVDGIARFWVHEDRTAVEGCLEELQARDVLHKRVIGGTAFYSLHRDAAPHTPPGRAAHAAAAPHSEARGRILVVDDDESVRKFIVHTLSEEGHSVAAAEDGNRAIAVFEAAPFDLVVTDLLMPKVSGMEVLQAVKRRRPSTEVIVVTAHASLETAIEALRHGAYDLITKPLDDIELLHRGVERALERQRLSTENLFLVENLQARNLEMKETVARLAAINEISQATTRLLNLNELYDTVVRLVSQHLKARRVSVLVAEEHSDTLSLEASIGISEHEVLKQRYRVGEGIAGRVAASQSPLLVPDIEKSEFKELRAGGRYTTSSFMISPLTVSYPIRYQRKRVGVINVSDKLSGDPFNEQDLEFLSTLASQVAVAIENARLVKEMEDGYLGALVTLIQSAENSSPETQRHSIRVAEVASAVAHEMGLAASRLEPLLHAAALHEVGRVGARESGNGHGPASGAGEEWTPEAVMAAERILAPIASLRAAREVILHSADRFDAAPVRFGVGAVSIPLESKILGTCDEFVCLAPANGRDPEITRKALETLRREAGGKHDPDVVAALCRLVEGGEMP